MFYSGWVYPVTFKSESPLLLLTVDTVCAVQWNGPRPENALISIIHLREVLPILRKSFLDMRRCMIFLLGHGPILAML